MANLKKYAPKVEYAGTPPKDRAEWYRVSAGFTIGNRVAMEGEIFHVSDLDVTNAEGKKVGSFRPLSLKRQTDSFGKIMYMPYDPSEAELRELGYGPQDEDEELDEELQDEDFESRVDKAKMPELRDIARNEFNQEYPDDMKAARLRTLLKKMHNQRIMEGDVQQVGPTKSDEEVEEIEELEKREMR